MRQARPSRWCVQAQYDDRQADPSDSTVPCLREAPRHRGNLHRKAARPHSHCCFTAHSDLDPALVQKITQAFVAIDSRDPAGKAVLEGEGCKAFVPGMTTGWETLEKAAEQAGIL